MIFFDGSGAAAKWHSRALAAHMSVALWLLALELYDNFSFSQYTISPHCCLLRLKMSTGPQVPDSGTAHPTGANPRPTQG